MCRKFSSLTAIKPSEFRSANVCLLQTVETNFLLSFVHLISVSSSNLIAYLGSKVALVSNLYLNTYFSAKNKTFSFIFKALIGTQFMNNIGGICERSLLFLQTRLDVSTLMIIMIKNRERKNEKIKNHEERSSIHTKIIYLSTT